MIMDLAKSNPILGIVVPISRMAGNLGRLEEWVLGSEGLPIEIVLVHDFKDQETQNELENLVTRANRISLRLFKVEFGNPGETRNFGFEKISAKWVQFVDSDDQIDICSSLEVIKSANTNSDVLITNYAESNLVTSDEKPCHHNSSLLRVALNPGIWRMIFSINAISDVRFSRHRMGEDQLFLIELNFFQRKLEFSDALTYKYFVGGGHQLTNDRGAISEIKDLIFQISQKFPSLNGKNDRFVSIMIARLTLTLIKFESAASIWSAIMLFSKTLSRFTLRGRISILLSLFVIFLRRIA
jgi:glycosyltransferase involved in cell wall biosynthesis